MNQKVSQVPRSQEHLSSLLSEVQTVVLLVTLKFLQTSDQIIPAVITFPELYSPACESYKLLCSFLATDEALNTLKLDFLDRISCLSSILNNTPPCSAAASVVLDLLLSQWLLGCRLSCSQTLACFLFRTEKCGLKGAAILHPFSQNVFECRISLSAPSLSCIPAALRETYLCVRASLP